MPSKDTHEESQHGSVFSVSGPVIVAENMIGCAMYELVGRRRNGVWTEDWTRMELIHFACN